MSFEALGLAQPLVQAVTAAGYVSPTPVQQQSIPAILQNQDLMVAAQTGTGKTGSFALPILQKLFFQGQEPVRVARQVRVLVLTPTRELAAQVHESFQLYAENLPLESACIFGGVGQNPQVRALAKGVDVLVACPGRLLDLVSQQLIDLASVETLVLDEADRMLDMGFIHDVKKILKLLPQQRQNLLFSATFSTEIVKLASKLLHEPVRIEVTPANTTVERIEQFKYLVPAPHKRSLLAHLITMGAWEQVLVFTRTKHGANRLAEFLSKNGLSSAAIHGNKSQNARTKALADFKDNKLRVLVATDIAARGLDIDQLPHVVNYELPNVEEDYVHRIGRTGRAGRAGQAVSLVAHGEQRLLRSIEKMIGQEIAEGDWLNFDPVAANELVSSREDSKEPAKTNRANTNRTRNSRQQTARDKKPDARAGNNSRVRGLRRNSNNKNQNSAVPRLPADRAPDEFLDDAIDNFGNSVDYVSPYQNQDKKSRSRTDNRQQGHRQEQQRKSNPRRAGANNKFHQGKPRHQQQSPLFASADPTPAYLAVKREREKAVEPLIIRKGERLPSLEQLEQLEARQNKKERPALLSSL